MPRSFNTELRIRGRRTCDVVVVGAGLAGLCAARAIVAAGKDAIVLEAQGRVGGRTLTERLDQDAFIDHGGQWVSPGQPRILALAKELDIQLFADWGEGLTVHWKNGIRSVCQGMFPPGNEEAEAAVRAGAKSLTGLARELPEGRPWDAPRAGDWDQCTFQAWLAENVPSPLARSSLARALEGVFGDGPGDLSLLAALAIIRSGAHEITRLVSSENMGSERRFAGGAQQLCEHMVEDLRDRVVVDACVSCVEHGYDSVLVTAGDLTVAARRAVITLPPMLAGRLRYTPSLPAVRDHLTQHAPMGWVIKVHCVYPRRFWKDAGLSGKVVSDEGAIRATADNSPPSGSPGILVGFFEGAQAVRFADATRAQRRAAAIAEFQRYFGPEAAAPLAYFEHSWGDDEFARGAYGGYWATRVWTRYGRALAAPIGPLHWAGTETSEVWNGKLDGAVHSGERAAEQVIASLG